MQKTRIGISLLAVVMIPLAIILISSNIAFRLPMTYQFYFTDKQAISSAGYDLTESQVSRAFAKYFSSTGSKAFQVYEKNGGYRDPVFGQRDQLVMKMLRSLLNKELIAGIFALIASIILFEFTLRQKMEEWLTLEGQISSGIVAGFLVLQLILLNIKSVRLTLYRLLIGVPLKKKDPFFALMHQGFAKSYIIFSTVIAIALLLLFVYILVRRTRPKGMIFYR